MLIPTSKSFSLAIFNSHIYSYSEWQVSMDKAIYGMFAWRYSAFEKDIVDDAELNDHLCLSRCSFQEAATIDAHHVRLKSHYNTRLSFFFSHNKRQFYIHSTKLDFIWPI